MTDFQELLSTLHEIQGASDPNHPKSTDRERLDEIFEHASRVLNKAGWVPDDIRKSEEKVRQGA